MDDREIVAAIVAGDPTGLADAYDQYAESLYGYCRWMLSEPADAAYAVQDAYVVAASRLSGLSDPRRLRPWLYAVARNECHRRRHGSEAGADEALDSDGLALDPDEDTDRAELRRLVRAALDGLSPDEREALELDLRHDLHGADLASVIGVPRKQAHALAIRARDHLDRELGVLLVARTGRRSCPELDVMLDDWDGRMTVLTRKRVGRHIEACQTCGDRKRGVLRPAVLHGMPPLAALPLALGDDVLELCTDWSPDALEYRQEVIEGAGPFRPDGFPAPVAPPRRLPALSGIAAAVGVVIAVAATGVVTVLALTGSHARAVDASRSPSAAASTPASGTIAPPALPTTLPSSSAPATTAPASVVVTTATKPKPKPTPTPTPRLTTHPPSPTPTVTFPSASASATTATAVPTASTSTSGFP
jgi:RNA polymerase sigma factor (sigma-70 family)